MAILIVDDDFSIRELLSHLLQEEGFEVTAVADGEEALNILNRGPMHPCLILLDLMMPRINGWEFRRQQKQNLSLAPIPVALMSADRNLQAQAAALDVDDYLDKPINLNALFLVVERYCCR